MTHVLIVEDNHDHAYILQRMMNQIGFLSSTCVDLFLILRRIEEKLVDCVTIDLSMPELSGIDIIKMIREIDKSVLIVVITASISDHTRIQCLQQGANYYITKPVNISDLRQILSQLK